MKLRTMTALAALMATGAVGGCANVVEHVEDVKGPPVVNTTTPYDTALACLKSKLPGGEKVQFAVGNVADRTGKFNYGDQGSGYWVTQGAGDILSSALFGAGNIEVVERQDTKIMEWELNLASKQVLGDGYKRTVLRDGKKVEVEYRGVKSGGMVGSDYYIAGSINSLDLSVNSIGASLQVAGVGPRARAYSMRVGLDLRVVETTTGRVIASTSVNKRLLGDEVGAGIGRFFGTTLVEFDAGLKRQEPLQLALRSMLHLGTFNLLSQIYNVPSGTCEEGIAKLEGVVEEAKVPTGTSPQPTKAESSSPKKLVAEPKAS